MKLQDGPVKQRIAQHNKAHPNSKIVITGNQAKPVGKYCYYIRQTPTTVQFSGFGSRDAEGNPINGRLVKGPTDQINLLMLEYGYTAAQGACLNLLNNMATAFKGNLDEVASIGMHVEINADPEFKPLPKVADGASDLLINVFGEPIGYTKRTAKGCSVLPNDMTVEITADVGITPELSVALSRYDAKDLTGLLDKTLGSFSPKHRKEFDVFRSGARELKRDPRQADIRFLFGYASAVMVSLKDGEYRGGTPADIAKLTDSIIFMERNVKMGLQIA